MARPVYPFKNVNLNAPSNFQILGRGAGAGATVVGSAALEASHVLKTTPGTALKLMVNNTKSSAQFIQLHDAAALPADAVVPLVSLVVAANANLILNLDDIGLPFLTGIVVCNSSTAATKTIGSADCYFTAVLI